MGVPKIVHQIWFDFSKDGSGGKLPDKYAGDQSMCRQVNSDWDFMLWDEEKCLNLMQTRYPEYVEMYTNYELPIQRVDCAKYFILHAFGGVYMDVDIKCRKPLEFTNDGVYLVKVNSICKYNNAFIASSRGDPFWLLVFDILKERSIYTRNSIKNLSFNWLTIFNTTGPFILDTAVKKYGENNIVSLSGDYFQSCDLCGNISTEDYYIMHYSDKKWSTDFESIAVCVWCSKFHILIVVVLILAIAGVLLLSYYKK